MALKSKTKTVASSSNLAFEGIFPAALWRKDWRGAPGNVGEVGGTCRNLDKNDFVIDFLLNFGSTGKEYFLFV